MNSHTPLVSFAMPVRNGARTIEQAIKSVQKQTVNDWELVISDNHSSDATGEICASFAAIDQRVRYLKPPRPLSQNENFCFVCQNTLGTYFRWCGDDDWLEPEYTRAVVEALERNRTAVLCTTLQQLYDEGDRPLPLNDSLNSMEGVVATDPATRLSQLLRTFRTAGRLGIDPIYSMMRREALSRTELVLPNRFGDFVLSCEMAILGRFCHVPEVLAHRRLAAPTLGSSQLLQFTNRQSWARFIQREISLIEVAKAATRHGTPQSYRLWAPMLDFALREHGAGLFRRLGLTN